MAGFGGKLPYKVWSCDRSVRKSVTARTVKELVDKGKQKHGLASSSVVKLVLEADGTEVEDDDYLQCLERNTTFILLAQGQQWMSADRPAVAEDEIDFINQTVADGSDDGYSAANSDKLKEIVEAIKKDVNKVITLSHGDMEIFAQADEKLLASLLGKNVAETRHAQSSCQRYLDDRIRALDAIALLETLDSAPAKRKKTK